ncbi:MAG: hypothetical protein V1676_05965 [Candidatus Diapherotrites archaeon]
MAALALFGALIYVALPGLDLQGTPAQGQNAPSRGTGLFTLFFSTCNPNGNCQPQQGESYSTCPEDCCDADCTDYQDSLCHAECQGYNGCSFTSGCNGLAIDTNICISTTQRAACCSGSGQSCSQNQYCSGGGCITCSTVCDNTCQGAQCYGIDPDCDASGNPTGQCCGNGVCNVAETCFTCSADCGSPACTADANCNDGNSSTKDACIGAGTCSAYCQNCYVACDSNASCNDGNSFTQDTCTNPGTCNSACSYCTIKCSSDAACNDNNSSTTDLCISPGTCPSYCSNASSGCTPACYTDANCSDSNSFTQDTCTNAGTCTAACLHTPCTIACTSNAQCDDSNSLTSDTCTNAGTCTASCTHSAASCEIICASNADCDDGIASTTDTCTNAGTCNAYCENTLAEEGQDGQQGGEDNCAIACSSAGDCDDRDALTSDSCGAAGTCSAECRHALASPAALNFKTSPPKTIQRGQKLTLAAEFLAGGNPVAGAALALSGTKGESAKFGAAKGGGYLVSYEIPIDAALGEREFTVSAKKVHALGTLEAEKKFKVNVGPAELLITLLKPKAADINAGIPVAIEVGIAYPSGEAANDAELTAEINGAPVVFTKLRDGVYSAQYTFTSAQAGAADLTMQATDAYANLGSKSVSLNVQKQGIDLLLALLLVLFGALVLGIIGLILLLIAALLAFASLAYMKERRVAEILARKKWLFAAKNSAAEKLRKNEISRAQYDELSAKYDLEIKKLDESLAFLEKRRPIGDIFHDLGVKARAFIDSTAPVQPKQGGAVQGKTSGPAQAEPGKPWRAKQGAQAQAKAAPPKPLSPEERAKVDTEINEVKETMKILEKEYFKRALTDQEYRQRMFDLKTRLHLLELKKGGGLRKG